jgi:formate dehydrogenase major subunit
VFLPGSSFLEKDGTFTNAERRISRVRKVMPPKAGYADWEVTQKLANALGYPMNYAHPEEIMREIAALTPSFAGVSYDKIERLGSVQWPCNDSTDEAGTAIMHVDRFVRGKGRFIITQYVPTDEKVTRKYPLLLTTGRILSQYNVGAQTRRTANNQWHDEDRLEIHPHDAEERGIRQDDWVGIQSRAGETVLRATVTERVAPGVVYTTFHFPESGANVITTDSSDWATNCPEYKVTAVQVMPVTQPSQWQQHYERFNRAQLDLLKGEAQARNGLFTSPKVEMKGPGAEVTISGVLDLGKESQALKVHVVPRLAESVALAAGAALLNPVVGIATLAAQKVLRDPVGRILSVDYEVSGSLRDPKVVRTAIGPIQQNKGGKP